MHLRLSILVVEDDALDFRVLDRLLRDEQGITLHLRETCQSGIEALQEETFDVVLLDMSLPDSKGSDTVDAFCTVSTIPVVVLSGMDDTKAGLMSLQHGAQDYLVKGTFDTTLLWKTVRYAIERHRLVQELDATRQEVRREREMNRLQNDIPFSPPSQNDENESRVPFKTEHASVFANAVQEYGSALDNALEQRGFKVQHNVSQQLQALAIKLGAYRVTPRDIIEIHTACIQQKVSVRRSTKDSFLMEEARYSLTGLLGHLCTFYRSQSPQVIITAPIKGVATRSGTDKIGAPD